MSLLLLRPGKTHLNLPENNLRLNQDYESNPAVRIITVIHSVRRRPRAQSIRDLLEVSIDINNLRGCGLAAQLRSDMEREKRYACNESGAV
jgi:hypothetical protein